MKDRIKALRKQKGLNQSQLGEKIGINAKSISMIESGQNKPTVQQIETFSRFFDVSADYLLFGIENSKDIEPIEREIIQLVRKDPDIKASLINFLDLKKKTINRMSNELMAA